MDRPFFAPYIDAVAAALRGLAATDDVRYERRDAGVTSVGAAIPLLDDDYDPVDDCTVRTELRWSPSAGWSCAYVLSTGVDSDPDCLIAALVPPPGVVVHAVKEAVLYDEEDRYLPIVGWDSPALSYLPAEMVPAVEAGMVSEAVARQLARYL